MDWHRRFLQQAAWTRDLRSYLFDNAGLSRAHRVLEVGCGTGAILSGLTIPAVIHGLDLQHTHLTEMRLHAPGAAPVCGDALALPYSAGVFDITFCHFFLLWVHDPLRALEEMKRVTHSGGAVLALAEPDHDSRVDKPEELAPLGRWQAEALRRQGADPGVGSRLTELFHQADIRIIETGTLRAGVEFMQTPEERELEWDVLEADLAGLVPVQEVARLKLLDFQAWERGERVLSVPTHFAWGKV
ncbi:MAG TPA: methyltransferase domain-containing protein [Anaerolineales bacterium]